MTGPEARGPDSGAASPQPSRRRFRPVVDNYLLVLVAIVLSFAVLGAFSSFAVGRAVGLAAMGVVFFLALRASGVRLSIRRFLAYAVPPVAMVMIAAALTDSQSAVGSIASVLSALLVLACIYVIARRVMQHERISVDTVMATLCIYLFIALVFAMIYVTISILGEAPFFAQESDPEGLDFIYFSFISITTTGYGDLSPVGGLGRMIAVIEVVAGQLYLVTVVALLIGNLGRARKRTD
jgi:hypothetical protein